MNHGADAYAAIGTEKSKGTMLFSISGMVERPGVYEGAFGVNLWELHRAVDRRCEGRQALKAVIPGGSSSAILTADEARKREARLTNRSPPRARWWVPAPSWCWMKTPVIVKALEVVLRFYAHESCGQCPPCREGTYWLYEIVHRIREGKGRPEDIELMLSICPDMLGRTVCVLADSAAIRRRVTSRNSVLSSRP
jgi:NADH-quinone oxidoreductase subunit F